MGEHEFLTEPKSFAFYQKAEALSQKDIDELISKGKLITYEKVSDSLLSRLQEGAKKTEYLPTGLVRYFQDF